MKSALLVIDVQQALFDETPRPFEADAVVERINSLTASARAAGVPVVFVQHEASDLEYNSAGWQLQPGLQLKEGDAKLRKTTPDSFLRTELEALLASWQTEHVVICGYASEFCVDTTTRRAAALGYPVTLVSDAHTTHDKPHATGEQIRRHENATLPNIESFGPEIKAIATSEVRFAD
ncbi:isochorismatase family protein [Collimonas fungivorans]|uniref:Isochorismatase family protein n=1 Tax=Collimonas fungivorans TaxID=158899 RepID=A0A127PCW2_9BURK|nr:cysteine hydrolase family protein [Collimonas fungivorans]AMO95638.1 isochorismatase family protein [Collimonas fungivorans]